ncbi:hypothetical protein ACS0TY_030892 [Phlomoides rotata]
MEAETMEIWNRETVPKVMNIVSTRLPQRDLVTLLLVSPCIHRNLISHPSLWLVLDFHEMNNAGDRLMAALSLPRYQNVKHINLEFARDIEDKHLEIVKTKCGHSIKNLEVLNLNGCQKISDMGIEFITYNCPKLKVFSIYWNVRVSDLGIRNLVNNCKFVIDLNLSGCKNVTDECMKLIAEIYQGLHVLNITRYLHFPFLTTVIKKKLIGGLLCTLNSASWSLSSIHFLGSLTSAHEKERLRLAPLLLGVLKYTYQAPYYIFMSCLIDAYDNV